MDINTVLDAMNRCINTATHKDCKKCPYYKYGMNCMRTLLSEAQVYVHLFQVVCEITNNRDMIRKITCDLR